MYNCLVIELEILSVIISTHYMYLIVLSTLPCLFNIDQNQIRIINNSNSKF